MKPGRRWRILAYEDNGGRIEVRSPDIDRPTVSGRSVLDEVVIDDWLHLEQMDTRKWLLVLGGFHFWITVPKKGRAEVTHNGQRLASYGMERDE